MSCSWVGGRHVGGVIYWGRHDRVNCTSTINIKQALRRVD